MFKPSHLLGFGLAFLVVGCTATPDDVVTAPLPAAAAPFEGKVDPALAGTWKSTDGRSTMTLNADGSSTNHAVIANPSGRKEVDSKGQWLTKEDTLLLKEEGKETVLYYVKRIDPKTMELRRVKDSNIVITFKKV